MLVKGIINLNFDIAPKSLRHRITEKALVGCVSFIKFEEFKFLHLDISLFRVKQKEIKPLCSVNISWINTIKRSRKHMLNWIGKLAIWVVLASCHDVLKSILGDWLVIFLIEINSYRKISIRDVSISDQLLVVDISVEIACMLAICSDCRGQCWWDFSIILNGTFLKIINKGCIDNVDHRLSNGYHL